MCVISDARIVGTKMIIMAAISITGTTISTVNAAHVAWGVPRHYAKLLYADKDGVLVATGERGAGGGKHSIQMLSAGDGKLQWTALLPGEADEPTLVNSSIVAVVSCQTAISCFDRNDGKLRWQSNLLSPLRESIESNSVETEAGSKRKGASPDYIPYVRVAVVCDLKGLGSNIVVSAVDSWRCADLEMNRRSAWVLVDSMHGRVVRKGVGTAFAAIDEDLLLMVKSCAKLAFVRFTGTAPLRPIETLNRIADASGQSFGVQPVHQCSPAIGWTSVLDCFSGGTYFVSGADAEVTEITKHIKINDGGSSYDIAWNGKIILLFRNNVSTTNGEIIPLTVKMFSARDGVCWETNMLSVGMLGSASIPWYVTLANWDGDSLWLAYQHLQGGLADVTGGLIVGISGMNGRVIKTLPLPENCLVPSKVLGNSEHIFAICVDVTEVAGAAVKYHLNATPIGPSAIAWKMAL